MAAAIELSRDNEITEGQDTLSAQRLFYNEGTTSGLPALGSTHPENANLFMSSKTRTPFGDRSDAHLFLVNYEPLTSSNQDENTAFDDLPRRIEYGGEYVKIAPQNKSESDNAVWEWKTAPVKDIPKDIDLTRVIPTGSMLITKIHANKTRLNDKIIAAVGRVNDAAFEDYDAGNLLYMGASVEEFTNSAGAKRWRAAHSFQFRLPTGNTGANLDGWNYIFRAAGVGQNGWDRPRQKNVAPDAFLYDNAGFDALFTT